MNCSKFSIGDRVVCIDPGPNRYIERGKEYVVDYIFYMFTEEEMIYLEGMDHGSYYAFRFEKAVDWNKTVEQILENF